MQIWNEPFPSFGGPFAVCIGKFDGLHVGHRLILSTLADEARRHNAQSVAYAFTNGGPLLDTPQEKLTMLETLGMGHVVQARLDSDFCSLTPEAFIQRLSACGTLRAVVVGANFRFGCGASGNVAMLRHLGKRYGFEVFALGQVTVGGMAVSSTRIRELVRAGDVENAAVLLGREYRVSGVVREGMRLGRQLGYPTANIAPEPGKVMPAYGVYAACAEVEGHTYAAMTDIGDKPTVGGREPLFESHLLGFDGDLYGKELTLRLVRRLRDEVRFESVEALTAQLRRDEANVRALMLSDDEAGAPDAQESTGFGSSDNGNPAGRLL